MLISMSFYVDEKVLLPLRSRKRERTLVTQPRKPVSCLEFCHHGAQADVEAITASHARNVKNIQLWGRGGGGEGAMPRSKVSYSQK